MLCRHYGCARLSSETYHGREFSSSPILSDLALNCSQDQKFHTSSSLVHPTYCSTLSSLSSVGCARTALQLDISRDLSQVKVDGATLDRVNAEESHMEIKGAVGAWEGMGKD